MKKKIISHLFVSSLFFTLGSVFTSAEGISSVTNNQVENTVKSADTNNLDIHKIPFNNLLINENLNRASSRFVNQKVTIKKGAHIPDLYFYSSGSYKGWLTLKSWDDYTEHPSIKGYICYYSGTVYSGYYPNTKIN